MGYSWEYMPEPEYNRFQADEYKKKAEATVFETMARKLVAERPPPSEPPIEPGLPPPNYGPMESEPPPSTPSAPSDQFPALYRMNKSTQPPAQEFYDYGKPTDQSPFVLGKPPEGMFETGIEVLAKAAENPYASYGLGSKAVAPVAKGIKKGLEVAEKVGPFDETLGFAAGAGRGTPPTGPVPATEAVLHTDVDKFISKFPDQDIQTTIRETIDVDPQRFENARRGVIPDDAVQEMATNLQMDPEKIIKRWNPGNAENAETIQGMRAALDVKTQQILDLRDEVNQAVQAGNDPVVTKVQLQLAIAEQVALQETVIGVRAEAGRALRTFRTTVSDTIANGNLDTMRDLLQNMAGRWDDKLLNEFLALEPENVGAMYKFIRDAQNPEWWKYPMSLRYSSMLSSVPTHVVNLVSNSLTTVLSPIEAGLSAAVDIGRGAGRERFFGEVPAMLFGMVRGVPKGLSSAVDVLKTGIKPGDAAKLELRNMEVFNAGTPRGFIEGPKGIPLPLGTSPVGGMSGAALGAQAPAEDLDDRIRNMGIGLIAGAAFGAAKPAWLAAAINTPTRALSAADSLWRSINFSSAMHAQAYRMAAKEGTSAGQMAQRIGDILNNPTPAMVKEATDTAAYRVFQQEPGKTTKWFLQGRRENPWMQIIAPFVQTPVNVVKYGMERSPLGAVNVATAKDAASRADALGRALLGTGIMAAAVMYAIDGKITGARPADPTEASAFDAAGKIPYAVKSGDSWYSYKRMEPFNTALTMAAEVVEAFRNDGKVPTDEMVMGFAKTMADNLISSTWATGAFDVVDLLENPQKSAGEYFGKNAASFVPFGAATRMASRVQDPTYKDAEGLGETFMAGIGLTKDLPSKISAFGEERKSTAGSALLPYAVSKERDEPFITEMQRLDEPPSRTGTVISGIKIGRELEQRYQTDAGQILRDGRDSLTKSDIYKKASDEEKARMTQRIDDMAKEYVRSYLLAPVYEKALKEAKPGDREKILEKAREELGPSVFDRMQRGEFKQTADVTRTAKEISVAVQAKHYYDALPKYDPELKLSANEIKVIDQFKEVVRKYEAKLPDDMPNKQRVAIQAVYDANQQIDRNTLDMAVNIIRYPTRFANPIRKEFQKLNPLMEKYLGEIEAE